MQRRPRGILGDARRAQSEGRSFRANFIARNDTASDVALKGVEIEYAANSRHERSPPPLPA